MNEQEVEKIVVELVREVNGIKHYDIIIPDSAVVRVRNKFGKIVIAGYKTGIIIIEHIISNDVIEKERKDNE